MEEEALSCMVVEESVNKKNSKIKYGYFKIEDERFYKDACSYMRRKYSPQDLEQLITLIQSKEVQRQHFGIIGMVKLSPSLSGVQIISNPKLISFIEDIIQIAKQDEFPLLQYQSLKLLSTRSFVPCKGVNKQIVIELLCKLLKQTNLSLIQEAFKIIDKLRRSKRMGHQNWHSIQDSIIPWIARLASQVDNKEILSTITTYISSTYKFMLANHLETIIPMALTVIKSGYFYNESHRLGRYFEILTMGLNEDPYFQIIAKKEIMKEVESVLQIQPRYSTIHSCAVQILVKVLQRSSQDHLRLILGNHIIERLQRFYFLEKLYSHSIVYLLVVIAKRSKMQASVVLSRKQMLQRLFEQTKMKFSLLHSHRPNNSWLFVELLSLAQGVQIRRLFEELQILKYFFYELESPEQEQEAMRNIRQVLKRVQVRKSQQVDNREWDYFEEEIEKLNVLKQIGNLSIGGQETINFTTKTLIEEQRREEDNQDFEID